MSCYKNTGILLHREYSMNNARREQIAAASDELEKTGDEGDSMRFEMEELRKG